MSGHAYAEIQFVERRAIGLFAEPGSQTVPACASVSMARVIANDRVDAGYLESRSREVKQEIEHAGLELECAAVHANLALVLVDLEALEGMNLGGAPRCESGRKPGARDARRDRFVAGETR